MKRLAYFLSAVLLTAEMLHAESRAVAQARNALLNLQSSSTELAKEAHRDAEILLLLTQAARSLDNWQKNNAVAEAHQKISKAEQLAVRPTLADPKVRQAVRAAREIIDPARESPMSADLQKLREQLHLRPVDAMRDIVAEEMHALASVTTQLNEASALLAKALASASAAVLGRE